MSNNHKKFVKEQISLFDMIQNNTELQEDHRSGSLNFSTEYAMVLSRCVTNSNLSVFQIAAKMTEYLNRGNPDDPTITHNMIYSWTAVSKQEYEPHPSWLPAFCYAVGSNEPIEFLVRKIGQFLMPGPDALRSEIQKIEEQMEKLKEEKDRRLLFLEQVNK